MQKRCIQSSSQLCKVTQLIKQVCIKLILQIFLRHVYFATWELLKLKETTMEKM